MSGGVFCGWCGARVIWLELRARPDIALDAQPCDDGTVTLDANGNALVLLPGEQPSGPRYRQHRCGGRNGA